MGTGGSRLRWAGLPGHVRRGVEEVLGSTVVAARSQPGGYSPGSADRLRLADGGSAFVKAVSAAQNPESPGIHRREAAVCRQLPPDLPTTHLLGSYDDGEWVALVLDDVEGRHPSTPWVGAELDGTLATLAELASRLTPARVEGLDPATTALAGPFGGWARLVDDPSPDTPPWAQAHLDDLVGLSEAGLAALAGDTLVHNDVRADNLLVTPRGDVVLVDWPHACLGAPWVDTLGLLVNVNLFGGHEVDRLAERYCAAATPDQVDGFLAGMAGYFIDGARRPAPAGIPRLRAFQRAQGDATLAWLRRRLEG